MVDQIIAALPTSYITGSFPNRTTFYFTVDEIKKTVVLDGDSCVVLDGKAVEEADCVCKTSAEMFNKIWNEGYRPSMMDFMGGKIKSNAPMLLPQFLAAFGK